MSAALKGGIVLNPKGVPFDFASHLPAKAALVFLCFPVLTTASLPRVLGASSSIGSLLLSHANSAAHSSNTRLAPIANLT